MNFKNILILFVIAVVVKQLIWLSVVPVFHFPDESSHFGQVQNYAKFGIENNPFSSDDIARASELLEVRRNDQGRNAFTLHPEFNIPYTRSYEGKFEEEIKTLPESLQTSNELGLREATTYPFLYYWLGSVFYHLAGNSDIITKVFVVRILSLLIYLVNLAVVYQISKLLFSHLETQSRQFYSLLLTTLVIFQPMYSFVGASISSDILFNVLFNVFILGCVYLLKAENKIEFIKASGLILVSLVLGLVTKQQMIIAVLVVPFLVLGLIVKYWLSLKSLSRRKRASLLGKGLIGSFLLIGVLYVIAQYGQIQRVWGFILSGKTQVPVDFWDHWQWSIIHTYREVIPWYWGVFKWLGVTYPRWVHRVELVLMFGAMAGLGWLLVRFLFKKWFGKISYIKIYQFKYVVFFVFLSLFYFTCFTMWHWFYRQTHGYAFGMQGRYFFPIILAHMYLVLVGWQVFIEGIIQTLPIPPLSGRELIRKIDWFGIFCGMLFLWWGFFHTYGVWTVVKAYYSLNSFQEFAWQISQYKPDLLKGEMFWQGFIALFLVSTINYFLMVGKETLPNLPLSGRE